MADLTDIQAAESVKIIGVDSSGNEQTPVQSTSNGAIHTNIRNDAGTEVGTDTDPLVTLGKCKQYTSYSPDLTTSFDSYHPLSMDGRGRLETHSTSLTDEGSFRDDFSGSSLSTTLTGSVQFTNGSADITGSGTLFLTEVKAGQYLKKTTESETVWVRVLEVHTDTSLTLEETYTGTTASVAGHVSNWKTTTGSGSFSTSNSFVTISSGTAAGTTNLYRDADYGPFSVSFKFSISQRIANQTIKIGVQTPLLSPTLSAVFQFTGTNNTLVSCISSSSAAAADTQTTTVFLPNNITSASTDIEYGINVSNEQITFIINRVIVATHRDHIIGAYDFLQTVLEHIASDTVTNTDIVLDWHNFYNVNQMEITNNFIGEPLVIAPVSIVERTTPTYSVGTTFTAASTPTDIFTITGSASKVVRIKKICTTMSTTNAACRDVLLIKRSTDNTGGTSSSHTGVPNDSDDLASTATIRSYTANPTLGTTVGIVRIYRIVIPDTTPTGGAVNGPLNEIYFGDNGEKSLVLRGTSEVLSINLNGITTSGNVICVYIEWTEENT